jgi:hypothetical protein
MTPFNPEACAGITGMSAARLGMAQIGIGGNNRESLEKISYGTEAFPNDTGK